MIVRAARRRPHDHAESSFMSFLNRRKLVQGSVAGAAIASLGNPAAFAQDDDKPTVTVGSLYITETILLGEMLVALLEDHGYSTETEHALGSTFVVHEARQEGTIDVHIEYTAPGLLVLEESLLDIREEGDSREEIEEKVYDIIRTGYEEQFDAYWLDSLGFNNIYVLTMRREDAEEKGIEKVSDLIPHAGDMTLGGNQEFIVRDDSLPGLEDFYGMQFGDSTGMDPGLLYMALDQGEVDVISGFTTDGRIEAMDFVMLEDDLNYFTPYYASPVVRGDLLEKAPETREILNSLAGKIDDATMRGLNYRVDSEEAADPRDVAREFLADQGLIGDA